MPYGPSDRLAELLALGDFFLNTVARTPCHHGERRGAVSGYDPHAKLTRGLWPNRISYPYTLAPALGPINVFMQNPLRQLAFMGIPVLLLYSLGRSIRYALSGE